MRLRLGGTKAREKELAPPPRGARTVIAFGATVEGVLEGFVDVCIGGALTGAVCGRTIAVDPRAAVDASLKAWVVDIAGTVHGRVEAHTVNVAKTAVVDATIVHHRLSIEKGAVVKGLKPWRPASDMTRRCEAWTPEYG